MNMATKAVPLFPGKRGSAINSKEKKVILNVYNYFQKYFPEKSVKALELGTAHATGFSEASVARIKSEMKKNSKVVTPNKKKPKISKAIRIDYGEITYSRLRKHIQNFFRRNESPTHRMLLKTISQDEAMPKMSIFKISQLLKEMGFKYKRRKRRSILIEKYDIVHWRMNYLQDVTNYRKAGRHIFYVGETSIVQSRRKNDAVKDGQSGTSNKSSLSGLKDSTSGEGCIIILHVGSEDGFIDGAGLVFKSPGKLEDDNCDMNGDKFEKWFTEELLPRLPPRSVIVMDNAPYHRVQIKKSQHQHPLRRICAHGSLLMIFNGR